MELLQDPRIMERIVEDLSATGYVGEDVNKQLMYLVATSRIMDDPISAFLSSQSASGKSLLIEKVRALMPPEAVVAMTSLSDQALSYLAESELMHTFLTMGEAVHAESVEHQIREMLSARELTRMVTVKDDKTGQMGVTRIHKKVVVALAMSTTSSDINPENASRCFVINADESLAQTRAVHEAQRGKYSRDRRNAKRETIPQIVARHQAAQRLLQPIAIENPYAKLLSFPARLMRTRRDHERFLDLIAVVCFLRQFQKQRKEDEQGERYIECDLRDYEIAYTIMSSILRSTMTNVPRSACELYGSLRELAREKAKAQGVHAEEIELSQREIRDATGLAQHQVKRALRMLCDYEYVIERGSMARGSRRTYKLVKDEELELVDIAELLSPETLVKKAKAEGIPL
jgi:predicted transcriptional regulator